MCVPHKITGRRFRPYAERLKLLSLPTLQHRRIVADLTFLHHLTSGKISASLFPHLEYITPSITRGAPSNTRGHHLKKLKRHSSNT